MDNKLKYNAYLLCERIRALTQELDKSIKDISHKTAIENDELYDKVYDKTYEKVYKPPAGISGAAWDNAIIQWKSSLRRPW
jgi:phosphoheptose isomerase